MRVDPAGIQPVGRRTNATKEGLLIAALAAGATHREAARAAGVSERTVRRRLESPAFTERLGEAEVEYLSQISKRLTGLAPTAVETLASLMCSPDATDQVRLRASLAVLNATPTLREVTEIAERLQEFEDHVAHCSQGEVR